MILFLLLLSNAKQYDFIKMKQMLPIVNNLVMSM